MNLDVGIIYGTSAAFLVSSYFLFSILVICSYLRRGCAARGNTLPFLVAAFAVALLLRLFLAPHSWYMGGYFSMYFLDFTHRNLTELRYFKGLIFSPILPLFASALHEWFGWKGMGPVFAVNIVFGSLTIFPIARFVRNLTGSVDAALFSAAMVALFPLHVLHSGADGTIITGLFFFACAAAALSEYALRGDVLFLIYSMICMACSVDCKVDFMVLIPVLVVIPWCVSERPALRLGLLLEGWFLFVFLFAPQVYVLLKTGFFGQPRYGGVSRLLVVKDALMAPFYLFFKLPIFDFHFNPYLLPFLAVAGLIFAWRSHRRVLLLCALWALIYSGIFGNQPPLFGPESTKGTLYQSLIAFIPYVVAASLAFAHILRAWPRWIAAIIVAAMLLNLPANYSFIRIKRNIQREYDFVASSVPKIPSRCDIYTQERIYGRADYDRPILLLDMYDKDPRIRTMERSKPTGNGCEIYYRGVSCYIIHPQSELERMRKSRGLKPGEHSADMVMNRACGSVWRDYKLTPITEKTIDNDVFLFDYFISRRIRLGFYYIHKK